MQFKMLAFPSLYQQARFPLLSVSPVISGIDCTYKNLFCHFFYLETCLKVCCIEKEQWLSDSAHIEHAESPSICPWHLPGR